MSTSSTEGQGQESTEGQGGQGQEPPANGGQGQEPGAAGGQTQGQEGGQGDQFDVSKIEDPNIRAWAEKVERDAKEARDQAARYRTERNGLQSKVTEYERANETADQKAQREAQEHTQRVSALEAENRDLKVGAVVRDKATAARAFNPVTVHRMIADRIQMDENGQPANVDQLLKDLRQSDPYLFRREGSNDAGAGNGQGDGEGQALTMNDQLRRAAGKA